MKQYNRALDYTALALAQLKAGKATLAARLLAKAAEQKDLTAAIATLEASNAHAFALQAKTKVSAKARIKANDDMGEMGEDEFDQDPLDEIEGDVEDDMPEEEFTDEEAVEEAPEVAMAKVLSKMVRKAGRK